MCRCHRILYMLFSIMHYYLLCATISCKLESTITPHVISALAPALLRWHFALWPLPLHCMQLVHWHLPYYCGLLLSWPLSLCPLLLQHLLSRHPTIMAHAIVAPYYYDTIPLWPMSSWSLLLRPLSLRPLSLSPLLLSQHCLLLCCLLSHNLLPCRLLSHFLLSHTFLATASLPYDVSYHLAFCYVSSHVAPPFTMCHLLIYIFTHISMLFSIIIMNYDSISSTIQGPQPMAPLLIEVPPPLTLSLWHSITGFKHFLTSHSLLYHLMDDLLVIIDLTYASWS